MARNGAQYEPVVIGVFFYASDARRAMTELREHQFSSDELGAAFRDRASSTNDAAGGPGAVRGSSPRWFGELRQLYHGDERPERLDSAGSATGFEGMLERLSISPHDTHSLDRDLDKGAAIVTVKAGDRNAEARVLLEQRGARIVYGHNTEAAEVPAEGQSAVVKSAAAESAVVKSAVAESAVVESAVVKSAPFSPPQPSDPDHIQLFGEVLRVHKEKVSSGAVSVRKESVTHMETVQVPVTREHLVVEHSDGNGRPDGEHAIRIPLTEERVHIDKDTVLREEYKVGKREITQNESVSDTVRRERLLIDEASGNTRD